MLLFTEVSKSFDDIPALKSLTLAIAKGQTTVLIGPSGCGKSTILRLVVGLLKPDTGTIIIDNKPLSPDSINGSRLCIGYVIQDGGLFPHLSAKQNICLLARHLGWDIDRIEERLIQLTQLFKLTGKLLGRYPFELSGGQQQRVSLMRAMMLDPDMLILDEPLAALDPMIRYELQQELKCIFNDLNKTVLLVTHDMSEAGFLGDNIVLLREGEIVQQGSMSDLLNNPAQLFVEQFIRAQRQLWLDIEERLR